MTLIIDEIIDGMAKHLFARVQETQSSSKETWDDIPETSREYYRRLAQWSALYLMELLFKE